MNLRAPTQCFRPILQLPGRRLLTSSVKTHHAVFLNAARLDYDQELNFASWNQCCDKVTLHRIDRFSNENETIQLIHDTQPTIIVAKEIPISKTVLEKLPASVQLLCEAGTGYNNWPISLARTLHNLPVCNVPTYSTQAVAHMAITFLMNFSVSMLEQQKMLQQNNRSNFLGPFQLPLHELSGQTLGLVGGAGKIGTSVAEVALVLGMNVMISSRRGELPTDHPLYQHSRVTCTSDLHYLLQNSDYVSLHTPLNDETRGSFGRSEIEQMKSTAYLINTSRGSVCREHELIDCLREGVIRGAGLDVTTTEPPPPDSELWELENVWLTPHTGWRRKETRQRLVDMVGENLKAFVEASRNGEDFTLNVIN